MTSVSPTWLNFVPQIHVFSEHGMPRGASLGGERSKSSRNLIFGSVEWSMFPASSSSFSLNSLLDANLLNYLLKNNVIDDIRYAVICYGAIKVHLASVSPANCEVAFSQSFSKAARRLKN